MPDFKQIQLRGRIFLRFTVQTVTGLHIGGSDTGIEIGGVDKTVIRDPLTNRPYIPGSSLKGKMRSLLEKYEGKIQNQRIGQGFIHSCQDVGDYQTCPVCQVFGVPGERNFSLPTRLVVRDVHMDEAEAERIRKTARTDLPYTEVKTEVSIDRVTSAANPRQMERVPAGTHFGPAELVYTIYSGGGCDPQADVDRLATLVTALQLVEDDYLGGLGSRGSGRVRFTGFEVKLRPQTGYLAEPAVLGAYPTLGDLSAGLAQIQDSVRAKLAL
ncbi:MAG: type III-A CRISPR-associated RAMP protein Csm3 [Chloroflexi bacterium]|nr:MAG: type III-A CRISPR-associated RAMP protein Csm3 [Chloroflexota bacterium]